MTGLVLWMKSPENFEVFIAMVLPLLILSCSVSNGGYSEAEVRYRSGVALQQAERL